MLVYHGTYNKPNESIKPKFVSPSFKFAQWFGSCAVEEGEPFWVVEFRLKHPNAIVDVDTRSRENITNVHSSWSELEKNEGLLKLYRIYGNKGVWMTENKEPTILLFEPENSLEFIGIEKLISK